MLSDSLRILTSYFSKEIMTTVNLWPEKFKNNIFIYYIPPLQSELCRWKQFFFILILFLFQIDFALATFFVVYFFIRFLAADDKLMFIFTIESLVDFFTVPVVFLTGNFLLLNINRS